MHFYCELLQQQAKSEVEECIFKLQTENKGVQIVIIVNNDKSHSNKVFPMAGDGLHDRFINIPVFMMKASVTSIGLRSPSCCRKEKLRFCGYDER